ncbi:MAG: hypothetical protein MUC68_12540 [Burkholderiaceae bacterium]|jgi:hypothetical protein|nr:hypothetical protein [Burkholderiaceae bacterium]
MTASNDRHAAHAMNDTNDTHGAQAAGDRAPRATQHPNPARSASDREDAPHPQSRGDRPGAAPAAAPPRDDRGRKSRHAQIDEAGQTEADGQGASSIGVSDR